MPNAANNQRHKYNSPASTFSASFKNIYKMNRIKSATVFRLETIHALNKQLTENST